MFASQEYQRLRRSSNQLYDSRAPMSTTIGRTIDWPKERQRERTQLHSMGLASRIWSRFRQWSVLIVATAATALLCCGVFIASTWLDTFRQGHCDGAWYASKTNCCPNHDCPAWKPWVGQPFPYIVLSVTYAAASALLVGELASRTAASGVPELKAFFTGFTMPGLLGLNQLAVKTVGLCLAVASGLWIGFEGPFVHIACCTAAAVASLLLGGYVSEALTRDLLLAAATAGVSLAFNAPVGGVLFILEVFRPQKKSVLWQGFVCAMTASVLFDIVNPFRSRQLLLYHVSYDRIWHSVELPLFAILGCLCGALSALTLWANSQFMEFVQNRLSVPPLYLVMVAAAVTAIFAYPVTLSQMPHFKLLSQLFQECGPQSTSLVCNNETASVGLLFYTFLSVLVFAPTTYGLAIPAGILLPALLLGATTGRLFGSIIGTFLESHRTFLNTSLCPSMRQCVTPGVYALVGAGAALTGVTRLTVASGVIIFEMTGALSYIIPIMTGIITSKWVADALRPKGIYEDWVAAEKLPVIPSKIGEPLPNLQAADIMKPVQELAVARFSDLVSELRLLTDINVYGFPVINERYQLVGFIQRSVLVQRLPSDPEESFDLKSVMDTQLPMLSVQASLTTIVTYVRNLGLHTIFFVEKGELKGLMSQVDVWRVTQPRVPLLRREISYRVSMDRELPDI